MNLCKIVWAFLVGLIHSRMVESADKCCAENVLMNPIKCADGKMPLPQCDSFRVFADGDSLSNVGFRVKNDSSSEFLEICKEEMDEDFMNSCEPRYIVKSPNFCLGKYKDEKTNRNRSVALFCHSELNPVSLANDIYASDLIDLWLLDHLGSFDLIANILSSLLLATAFYVYYLVIQTRKIEDICLLNVAGGLSLAYVAHWYEALSDGEILPDIICITKLYMMHFFYLTAFAWYVLFMYYVWKQCRSSVSLEYDEWIKQLRIIGYGVPAILIILANIHAHLEGLYRWGELETNCFSHELIVEEMYVDIPSISAIALNCFFWSLVRKLADSAAIETNLDELNPKSIRSLLTLNQRLIFALGLPWILRFIFSRVIDFYGNSFLFYFWLFFYLLSDVSGIFIALILVMSRARVWRCVIIKYENWKWLQKWQPSDEEISSVTDNNYSRTLPSEV